MSGGKWTWLALGAAFILAQGSPSFGLVIAGGDGSGNTSAPSTDPGWANVGAYNDGGCVYIGNGWVLTAGHVYNDNSNGDPVFGTTPYTPDGTVYKIQDPNIAGDLADLTMFHLTTIPAGLPALTISSSQPPNYSQVTAIGYGYDRQATEVYWNSAWQQVAGPPAAYSGYFTGTAGTERWGTNTIVGSVNSGNDGNGTLTDFLYCTFNSYAGPNNFQVATYDSGGAVFYQGANGWQLTGIILAEGELNGQPGSTAVYGDRSYFANLGSYYAQGSYYSQIMHELLSDALPGDANLDGRVDINDLTIVLTNLGRTGATWMQGDFVGSGTVDINDLTIVLANYNASVAAGIAAVPEPAVGVLLAALVPVVAWVVGCRRAARKSQL